MAGDATSRNRNKQMIIRVPPVLRQAVTVARRQTQLLCPYLLRSSFGLCLPRNVGSIPSEQANDATTRQADWRRLRQIMSNHGTVLDLRLTFQASQKALSALSLQSAYIYKLGE